MSVYVKCSCGRMFLASDALIGKRAKCPICKQYVQVPDPRKQFANQVVSDQMQRNSSDRSTLQSLVHQVGRDLEDLGAQINKLQDELAEFRRTLNSP